MVRLRYNHKFCWLWVSISTAPTQECSGPPAHPCWAAGTKIKISSQVTLSYTTSM